MSALTDLDRTKEWMTRFAIRGVLVAVVAISAASIAAGVPGTMNYQGRLTDGAGNPVADVPHSVTFRIYDEADSVCWEESHAVTTADGFFSVELGSNGTPLTADVFAGAECWLGITVDGDPEISPRTPLSTAPYAFKVGSVQSLDIVNEAGVAAFVGPSYPMYLDDSAYSVVCSLTIDCPADGYVMAVAHGRIATLPQHTTGTNSHAVVGISNVSTSLPGNQDLDFQIDSAAPSGVYSVPYGLTSMFEAPSAGSYTYYCLAYVYPGSPISVADIQFNLVYFPTAYGTVDPVPPPQRAPGSDDSIRPYDLIERSVDTVGTVRKAVDIHRLTDELARMKARIETIQRQIDSLARRTR